MTRGTQGWRLAISILLVLSGVLFVVGTRIERATESRERRGQEVPKGESGEGTEHREGERTVEGPSESRFGINPDSTPAVAAGAAISLLLALAIWLWRSRWLVGVVALLALAFAGLDLREVFPQIDRSRMSVIVIAALLTAMHLAVGVLAASLFRSGSSKAAG